MNLRGALGLGSREFVAFVGAGGKKTAMQRLAVEGTDTGLRVGYTTTTAMPPPPNIPLTVTTRQEHPYVLSEHDPPLAFASEYVTEPERVETKVRGFDPDFLQTVFDSGEFDWVLVKADGARMREFKAPNDDEPVIPDGATHVVPVASVKAVGKPLSDEVVHRPERVAELTDLAIGDTITAETVGTVLAHPDGGLKHVPPAATVTPMVNKADTREEQAVARDVLDHALEASDRFARGLVTSFEADVCETVEPPASRK